MAPKNGGTAMETDRAAAALSPYALQCASEFEMAQSCIYIARREGVRRGRGKEKSTGARGHQLDMPLQLEETRDGLCPRHSDGYSAACK
jgi:hypothetical protein